MKNGIRNIIPEVLSLFQYQEMHPKDFRPTRCPHCGKEGLWCHGHYDRKIDHNFVPIFRYFCPHCCRTCSTLPEYLSPGRRYVWDIQQTAIILAITGKSFAAIAKKIMPSRHTISRWLKKLKEQWQFHKNVLCKHFADLNPNDFNDFWLTCLKKIPLSQAMRLCNDICNDVCSDVYSVEGVSIP